MKLLAAWSRKKMPFLFILITILVGSAIMMFAKRKVRVTNILAVSTFTVSSHQPKNGDEAQLDRHNALKAACDATGMLRPNDTLEYLSNHTAMLSKMIYDDEHELIYCYIAKVSTSQWKKMLAILTGRLPTNMSKKRISSMKLSPHDGSLHHFLSDLSGPEIRRRLETYTSFLFVRHPLERLVSGYRNKFRSALMDRPWQIKHSLDMIAHSQGREPWQVGEEGPPNHVTFEQFARWIADAPPPDLSMPYQEGPNDEHWRPMTELCHPCSVPYTVLGRYETMQDDARFLLKLANITSVTLPEKGAASETTALTGQLVGSLSPETLRRVLRHYLQDFVLFGYQPEKMSPNFKPLLDNIRATFHSLLSEV